MKVAPKEDLEDEPEDGDDAAPSTPLAPTAEGSPYLIVAATVLGFVFGTLGAARWDPPDDDFPRAPPPRFLV